MDTKTILNDASNRMQKAIDHLEEELLNVRAGKASPNVLNGVMVDYFGSQVPVSGAASVTVPDAKTILIQPWDKKMLRPIEKAILDSNIGLTPSNNGETIRLTMFISIPAAVGLGVLAFPITGVLFPSSSSLSGKLLMMGAVSVVFSALSTITNSVLQSIGQQKKALHNAAISLGMDLVVLALILAVFPKTNIYAVVFAGILFSLSMCVLNNLSIRKHLNFRNEFKNTYVKPLIAAAIMGVVTWVVYYGLFAITKRPSISMLIAILIAIVVYLIAFVVVTGTTEAEMRRMPMGTKLVKVLRILRIYR